MKAAAVLAFLLVVAALGAQLYLGAGVTLVVALALGGSAGLLIVATLAAFDALAREAIADLVWRGAPIDVEDRAHATLLAAAGVCLHVPGLAAKGCDYGVAR